MQIFSCPHCQQDVFFSNLICACGSQIYFNPDQQRFETDARPCANHDLISCNWKAMQGDTYCRSCAMTKVIPDTFRDANLQLWRSAEGAKRWVLANLSQWGWFTGPDLIRAPDFHLLAEETRAGPARVIMGHDNGLITINLAEANPTERTRRRENLGEVLRTMTAHFRHEIAHFLFLRLSGNSQFLFQFREQFGDERKDYGEALNCYYEKGAPESSALNYVSRYATSHPHEDWAESAAHVMHLVDILDSAQAASLTRSSRFSGNVSAYRMKNGEKLITEALHLGIGLNHVTRSMGMDDLYPFVTSQTVREKLIFAHRWISRGPTG